MSSRSSGEPNTTKISSFDFLVLFIILLSLLLLHLRVCHYSLTVLHPPVSCWKCVSSAWRRWEQYLQTPMFTCYTWCTRPWVYVSTCRTGMVLWAMGRRLFNLTGKMIGQGGPSADTDPPSLIWAMILVYKWKSPTAVFTIQPTLWMWRPCIWNWDVCIWDLRRRHKESELWRRWVWHLLC